MKWIGVGLNALWKAHDIVLGEVVWVCLLVEKNKK